MPKRLLVISPLHNEAAHLGRLVASMRAQTRPPDLWVLVDDGSTDETPALLVALCAPIPFARVLTAPQPERTDGHDRLAVALEARAFNWALAQVGGEDFDYVGKLDGDIELDPTHFERLLAEFQDDPKLGIVGCAIAERRGASWLIASTPPYFVHGAVKLYSTACLSAIGGIREQLGWDIVDEAAARMLGMVTRSIPDLIGRHHRQSGSAQGRLRGHARAGESVWIAAYPPIWILLRSFKVAAKLPRGLSGLAFLFGYLRAAARGVQRVEDAELRAFIRAELHQRLSAAVRLRLGAQWVSALWP